MYLATRTPPSTAVDARGQRQSPGPGPARQGMATVVLLGVTSLFTDLSSEMVTSTLPLLLTYQLRLSPLLLGAVDGVNQGAAAIVRVASGVLADRRRRYKPLATFGYGLSAVSRFGLLVLSGSWLGVLGVQLLDRVGKGIRTSPRDAMVSMAVPRERLAWGFGIHRSFDTAGAMLGPLLAFFILSAIPGAYDTVILLSAVVAVVGVAVIGLFVQDPVPAVPEVAIVVVERPRTLAVLRDAPYRRIVVVASLLSLATISDAFVYLSLRDRADFAIGWFPLLYVATAAVYLVTAPVIGRAADGLGRGRVLVLGHVLLLGVYAILLRGAVDAVLVGAALVLFGLYYAATDGVLAAMVSAAVDEERRATALGILATGTSIGRLGGSVVFGLVWTVASNGVAVRGFAVGLVAALCGAVVVLRRLAEPA